MRRAYATWFITLAATAAAAGGCGGGDDDGGDAATGGTAPTSAVGTSSTTTAGAGGGGATSGAGGATSGAGGQPFVDPIAGIDPPTAIDTDYEFTEGTAWVPSESLLFFSDIPADEIYTVDENDTVTLWTGSSNGTNGNALAEDGTMISCEQSPPRVVRRTNYGDPSAVQVVADTYNGLSFNRPNDVIVRGDGHLYFTDPNYAGAQSQPFQGVYHVTPDGTVNLVDDAMDKPNGIALSPDETILYVTDAARDELWAFDVTSDGSVAGGSKRKLADTNGVPDGFAVDDQGYLYLTTDAGIDVHAPDGSPFGNIPVPQQPANCTFGGSDRRTLYITARSGVYKVRVNVPGRP
ncbi:MAG: SMP-30/gluconolactonase/LRE family protein [Myxococcota bacterium]